MPKHVLADEDYATFTKYFQPRVARRSRADPLESLEAIIAGLLGTAQGVRVGALHQAARLFKVHRGDGLSFITEKLAEIVAVRLPTAKVLAFVGMKRNDLPEIFTHVGLGRSLKACSRAGVYDAQVWRKVVIDTLIVAAAIAIVFVVDRMKAGDGRTTDTVVFLTALSGVLGGILTSHVKIGRDPEALKTLAHRLDEGCARPDESRAPDVQRAVTEMARAFHRLHRPTCVVIDDFSRVDAFTKAVLYAAMKVSSTGGSGSVFWIVVEQIEAGELSRQLATQGPGPSQHFAGPIEQYSIEPLTPEEQAELLRHHNAPSVRVDARFVKALVRGADAAEVDQMIAVLDAVARTESTADVRATTLVRVIAANTEPPGYELAETEYVRIFSQESGLFPILLSAHLPNVSRLPQYRVNQLVKELGERLDRMVSRPQTPTGPLRVGRLGLGALNRWPVTQFPKESIELFWFLWWYRRRFAGDRSTALLQKLARHAGPARLDRPLLATAEGPALADETIHALIRVVNACLHQTLIADALATATALLENVRVVLSTPGTATRAITDKTWASIAGSCWQVYLASGAEEFLLSVLAVLGEAKFGVAVAEADPGSSGGAPDVGESFLRVMNASATDLGVMSDALRRLLVRDEQLGMRLSAHMRCRTLEIVARCERFAPSGLVEKSGFPPSHAVEGQIDKALLVDICDDIYVDADRRFTIIDHAVLRDALFYAVRARDMVTAQGIISVFTLAPEAAAAAKDQRPLTVLERAFRLYSIAVCLDALLRLAVGMSRSRHPRYQPPSPLTEFRFRNDIVPGTLADRIREVLAAAAAEFGGKREKVEDELALSPAVLIRVSDLYLQAAMAWEALGLEQLRNRTHMDRANFLFEFTDADPATPATFERVIQSLGPALSGDGMQSVMNHLEVAEFFHSVRQMRSLYITEALTRLLRLNVPSDLSLVFCMFLNGLPSGSSVEVATAADHVVKLLENDEFLDHFVERFGGEAQATPALVNNVFNAASSVGRGALKPRAFALLERLRAHPRLEPNVRHELTVLYDYRSMQEKPSPTEDSEVQAALAFWESRRDHWLYPAALNYLLSADAPSPAVVEKCLSVLEGDPFESSPPVRLALRVGHLVIHTKADHLRKPTIGILLKAAATAGQWWIELAIETYMLLMLLDRDNGPAYMKEHAYWTGIRLQHAKAETFAHLLHQGFYFGVFRSYWEGLAIYGLPHAPIDPGWCAGVRDLLRAGDRGAAVERCLTRMRSAAPPMIIRPNNDASVADDYDLIGQVLFDEDVKVTEELRTARDTLNAAAKRDLRTLIEVVLMADTVPSGLREIVGQQRQFIAEALAAPRSAA